MRSRTLAAVAVLLAIGSASMAVGCSETLPPPTVDNTAAEATKSVDATLGVETMITVDQLSDRLEASGLKVVEASTEESGVFLPAKYRPIEVDGAFVQTYRFTSPGEAKGAARTVDADGYVLGATPGQLINVNWTGWPAFFRSGDLVVIFVTEKGTSNAARDARVYDALQGVLGAPFIGGNTPPPSLHATSTPATTGTAPATVPSD